MLSAEELKSLKAKFDVEWTRRSYVGSMVSYANQSLSPDPVIGEKFYANQFNVILNPIAGKLASNLIGDLETAAQGEYPPSDLNSTFLTNLYNTLSQTDTVNGAQTCNGSCSGLCRGECSSGCSGSCTGGCSGSCKGGCQGCGSACSDGCTSCTSCSGSCSGGCTGGCMYTCYFGCATTGFEN